MTREKVDYYFSIQVLGFLLTKVDMINPSSATAEEVVTFYDTSVLHGLGNADISRLREMHGFNRFSVEEKDHIVIRYIEQFKDPLILMLIGSAILSVLVNQLEDAVSILGAVLIVGSVAFYQEYQSEQCLEALTTLVPPRCNVLRSGAITNILAEALVPGDIVRLQAGDRVPADARIIQCQSFAVDESSLTGEAEQREKDAMPLPAITESSSISDKANMVFMSTLVTAGNATAVVVAIAGRTEFGKTFEETQAIEEKRTPLQEKMDKLGQQLSIFSFVLITIIGIIGILQGKTFLSMFNIGVSLAVAAIPEGLPICVTVTLALGVMRMAQKNAIVKKLPAVEALGCANIICCDKTGTLTQNRMTVMQVYAPVLGATGPVDLTGMGAAPRVRTNTVTMGLHPNSPDGSITPSFNSNNDAYPSLPPAAQVPPVMATGAALAEAWLGNRRLDLATNPALLDLFDAACLCNNAYLSGNTVVGQPMEGALLHASFKLGLPDRRSQLKRVGESVFSSETRSMECRYEVSRKANTSASVSSTGKDTSAYIKGALEVILPQCVTFIGPQGESTLLTNQHKEQVKEMYNTMSKNGLRVIALARGGGEMLRNQFCLCGLMGLQDPLREGVEEAVARIQQTGARVMMITGDAEHTAVNISMLAGIYVPETSLQIEQDVPSSPGKSKNTNSANDVNSSGSSAYSTSNRSNLGSRAIISGAEIEELARVGDEHLANVLEGVSVCYRTSPRHKLLIVRALQSKGNVVAMTGDGVNDAPALKKADIGVAVGSGTDVAKEAAHMVILDDDFATIVNAIEEGKSIFYNIKNFLTFQLSTSVAALSLVAIMNVIGRPNPLNAMQILWINIIMDGPLAQSLGVEIVDTAVMLRPPRKRTDDVLTRPLLNRVFTSGILIMLGTMLIFILELDGEGKATPRDLTMTFTTFVMFDMFNALACRNNNRPFYELPWNSNSAFLLALSFSLLGQLAVIYFPPFQKIFRTEGLSTEDLLLIVIITCTMLLLDTLRKLYFPAIFTEAVAGNVNKRSNSLGWSNSFVANNSAFGVNNHVTIGNQGAYSTRVRGRASVDKQRESMFGGTASSPTLGDHNEDIDDDTDKKPFSIGSRIWGTLMGLSGLKYQNKKETENGSKV